VYQGHTQLAECNGSPPVVTEKNILGRVFSPPRQVHKA
jgi:hypothetical protein